MIISKLTSKAQTTIPQPVRTALGLQPGDALLYELIDERVILTKARRGTETDDPFRTFEEWSSEADTKAYADRLTELRELNVHTTLFKPILPESVHKAITDALGLPSSA